MANGKIRFGKQSGGLLSLVIPDGVDNTEVIVPESGILATKQYVDDANVALTTNQTIAGIKTFSSSPIVPNPTTGTQAANKVYVDNVIENSKRSIIQYRSAHEVRISGGLMSFSGFRFKGQYQKKATKSLFQEGSVIVNSSSLPWGMTTRKQESWYAVFACANENDTTITYKCVPFMRIHSSTGANSFYLSENTGEGKHTVGSTFAYDYNNSLLSGLDVLICSETIDARPNAISGRVTKIVNAGSNSVRFIDNGGIGALDYILIAPDFDHYRYCGSFYEDTHEVRNIADSGNIVVSRGINQMTYPADGSATTATACSVAGYISPLATGVILNDYFVINTTAAGYTGTTFLIDSSHNIISFYPYKSTTETAFQSGQFFLPFSFKQEYFANAMGTLLTRTSEKHNIYGWIEE